MRVAGSAPSSGAPSAPASALASPVPLVRPAQLVLTGEGTTVRIDGAARGSCPLRLSVAAGTHSVEFTFPATGESQVETLALRPDDRVALRADFTGARPTIRVER
jgi:hypothetical protein